MSKVKISIRKNQLIVKVKLSNQEYINNEDMNVFHTKLIRGLIRPTIKTSRKINYVLPKGLQLIEYLHKGIDRNKFFFVMVQVIEIIKKIEKNKLNFDNLITDLNFIFINEITNEINAIYIPRTEQAISNNVFTLLYQITNCAVLQSEDDVKEIEEFASFLRGVNYFNSNEIEKYILNKYPQVSTYIRIDKSGQSDFLYSKRISYYQSHQETGSENRNEKTILSDAGGEDTELLNEEYENTLLLEEESNDTALLNEEYEDTLLLDEESLSKDLSNEYNDTALLDDEEDATLLEEYGNTELLEEAIGETQLLNENDGGTTLLEEDVPQNPFLIRLSTYEKVDIDKSNFRIGKEKNFVDYYIANNNAVSRIHADIVFKTGKYFIKDNNSTNRTFVNGTEIPVDNETEILDGDVIMLANEAFEFHID